MIGELPEALEVNGTAYAIRTDFRDVLNILQAFLDPELEDEEKVFVCLYILFEEFDQIPQEDYAEAFQQAKQFIDCGMEEEDSPTPRTMDWEQDAPVLFPAVNRVAGCEVRALQYLHWWTFMGYFMELSNGTFSQVLTLRSKRAHGQKLEKWEQEFWNKNKSLCVLRPKLTEEEQAAKDRLNELLG